MTKTVHNNSFLVVFQSLWTILVVVDWSFRTVFSYSDSAPILEATIKDMIRNLAFNDDKGGDDSIRNQGIAAMKGGALATVPADEEGH